ncbi:MAG: hypothetical protein HY683_06625 [Chloroflexi bacterium]|nr:hypothetical protein [Chloroflexota bacterium]
MSLGGWQRERVLITVRTYPTPARKGVEVSCTAGITESGNWIRLFPVPYRFMDPAKRFRKYQWIEVDIKKASDTRPESYELAIDSVRILGDPLPTTNSWQLRKDRVYPLKAHCLCCLKTERDEKGYPTLGIFKPRAVHGFDIEKSEDQWTEEQLNRLRMTGFWGTAPREELQKIPYDFYYRFTCDERSCPSHKLSCTDWEIHESYRQWSQRYGRGWEAKFRERYETTLILSRALHFYVGTVHQHPASWIIVGLFYPPA